MASRNQGSNAQTCYVNIALGKIRQRVPEGTPGAEKRIITNNQTRETKEVLELSWADWEDFYIKGWEVKTIEDQNRKELRITLDGALDVRTEMYSILSVPFPGNYAEDFLMRVPCMNPAIPVKIKPVEVTEMREGKEVKNQFLVLYQKTTTGVEVKVDRLFGKREAGKVELPKWKQVDVGGKLVWDKREYLMEIWKESEKARINVLAEVAKAETAMPSAQQPTQQPAAAAPAPAPIRNTPEPVIAPPVTNFQTPWGADLNASDVEDDLPF
jgi:hypothetical protein